MGLSGKDYDRFSGPDFTPNKNRRMAEWRKNKDAERQAGLAAQGATEAAKASEAENKPEVTNVVNEPVATKDTTILNAITNGMSGEVLKKDRPRRKHFDKGHQPTLFDEVE